MKTPQQMKNEVEKGCGIHLFYHFGENIKCGMFCLGEVNYCNSCQAKLSILTEYDRSIKEMIEEFEKKINRLNSKNQSHIQRQTNEINRLRTIIEKGKLK